MHFFVQNINTLPIDDSTNSNLKKVSLDNSPDFQQFKGLNSIVKTTTEEQVKYEVQIPQKSLNATLLIHKNLPARFENDFGDTLFKNLSMDSVHSPTDPEPLSLDQVKQAVTQLPNSIWEGRFDFNREQKYLLWWPETDSTNTSTPYNVEYHVWLHAEIMTDE